MESDLGLFGTVALDPMCKNISSHFKENHQVSEYSWTHCTLGVRSHRNGRFTAGSQLEAKSR